MRPLSSTEKRDALVKLKTLFVEIFTALLTPCLLTVSQVTKMYLQGIGLGSIFQKFIISYLFLHDRKVTVKNEVIDD